MTTLQSRASAADGAAPRMARSASTGRIWFWQGGSLWIGQGHGRTEWHQHHAHQLVVAPSVPFRFRTEAKGRWHDFLGAVVPSHCSHQFELEQAQVAHVFVEPESRAGRALAARFGGTAVAELPADESRASAQALFRTFATQPTREVMVAAAQALVATLCGATTEPDRSLDPRLARALAHIHAHVREPLALGEVARAVALSEGRFRHLFVEQTGSSFRAYLLWLRINLAIEAVMGGSSWTDAAHAAGFADSAHLTRTHKRLFGIEPSAIRPMALPAGPT